MQNIENTFQAITDHIWDIFGREDIALHRPLFIGNEKKYLVDCVDSNFVSSAGPDVEKFENEIARYTESPFAIATVNGTAALHIALHIVGVKEDDEVITQALSFVATSNAIKYNGAYPVFVDVDRDSLSLSPVSLNQFLEKNAEIRSGSAWNKGTGRRISACLPMHTFGLPGRIQEIDSICREWGIALIEDCAESLGSYVGDKHTGTFGQAGVLSFNGNKVITTGGGGMVLTNDACLARAVRHISTTAKVRHPYEFLHDMVGYNYRMPSLNAALGLGQLENLSRFLEIKAGISKSYADFFSTSDIEFVQAREGTSANWWLNAIVLDSKNTRDAFLDYTNSRGISTRPVWKLMTSIPAYVTCQHDGLKNSKYFEERLVNLPSSVPADSV